MKNEQLFEAIGHMDEEFLTKSLKVTRKNPRRILWKAALVAAIVGGLAMTAAAAGGRLWGQVKQDHSKSFGTINGQEVELPEQDQLLDVQLDVPLEEAAPDSIQTIYVPANVKDSEWGAQSFNGSYIQVQWLPEGWKWYDTISLKQTAGGSVQSGEFYALIWNVPADDYYTKTITRGDQEFFYISSDLYETDGYYAGSMQVLYWTDGDYVFELAYPWWMEMDQAWEIVDDLTPVDNVDGYLSKVTDCCEENLKQKWAEFAAQYASDEPYTFRADVEKGWLEETERGILKVYAEFDTDGGTPQVIERVIAPQVEGVQMYLSTVSEDENGVVACGVMWYVPEYGKNQNVSLTQRCISSNCLEVIASAASVESVTAELVTWGEYTFYQVSYPETDAGGSGTRMLFWSDGDYAFCLSCPYDMPDVDVLEIINSITGA